MIQQTKEMKNKKNQKMVNGLIGIIGIFVISSGLFFTFFTRHQVSGDSMKPTLVNKDRILVKKHKIPKRYDLVTFDPEIPNEPSYVKRVIGLPGDQIWIGNDQNLYLRPEEAGKWDSKDNEVVEVNQLPDSTLKVTVHEEVARKLDGLKIIPANCYFVLGDNRKASKDSRTFGFIEKSQIEGVVLFRYYPF